MPDNLKEVICEWRLNGLAIGLVVGFIFEVFLIRNNKGDVRWFVSVLSVLAMGMMGWLSWCIAVEVFPVAQWKAALWTTGATANTWWTAKFAMTGQMFKVLTALILPERVQRALEKSNEEN